MDQWSAVLQDKWYIFVIGLVVLLLVIKLVKTVIKWVIVLVVLAALLFYGYTYKDKLNEVVQDTIGSSVGATVQDQAMKAIAGEAKEAKYTKNADGSYTIKTKSLQVDGKPGSNDVKITILGQSFTLKADETIQKFIDQAKQNQ